MIVFVDKAPEQAPQVRLTEHDDVVQQLSAKRVDHPLDELAWQPGMPC